MGLFQDIKKAKDRDGSGSYLKPGIHHVKINRVKQGKNWKKKNFFAVECEIVESTCEDYTTGTSVDWYVNLDGQYPDSALTDVKEFLATAAQQLALNDGNEVTRDEVKEQLTEDDFNAMVGEEQVLAGLELQAEGLPPKEGKKFVKVLWRTFGGDE